MKRYAVDLSKEFKSRTNEKHDSGVIGSILSVNPLKIGTNNNAIILDDCNITKNFRTLLDIVYSDGSREVNVGNKVLLILDSTGQIAYVIDKVVG